MNGHISSSGHSGIHGNLAQRSSVLISQSHPCCIRASCWCNHPISFLAYLMIFSQVLVLPVKPFPKESFLFLCPKNLIIFCQMTVFSNQPSRTSNRGIHPSLSSCHTQNFTVSFSLECSDVLCITLFDCPGLKSFCTRLMVLACIAVKISRWVL